MRATVAARTESPAESPADRARADAPQRLAAAVAGALLALVYLATLAPSVTFWDAGEFIAAIETFGIPHPPGTPLFVTAARAWTLLLPLGDTALEANLFSAASAAAAGAVLAWLVARWSGRAAMGVAAALAAGAGSSVWLNATETEVYSASLLLSALLLLCADRRADGGDARWSLLLAFLMALAIPLHLSALVAAPAAIALAISALPRSRAAREGAVLLSALVLVAGTGRASLATTGVGAAMLAISLALWDDQPLVRRLSVPLVLALGLSPLLVLPLRAALDPAINQGNPATLEALIHTVARRQYDVAPLYPRQAPLVLQFGNLLEWADWQWALGLAPGVAPSPWRTPVSVAFVALAVLGAREHRRVHPRSFAPTALLLVSATVGVVLYLNLKAGPTFGWGILPDDTPREARERDYFFALGFWTWGAWAGMGAMAVASRLLTKRGAAAAASAGLAIAALPVALNWSAVTRRHPAEAELPAALARAFLEGAPPRAVLLASGDNDSYPLWYLQQSQGVRPDVVVVTIPLLGAEWYRAELARRHGLLDARHVREWPGLAPLLAALAEGAAARERPLAANVTVGARERSLAGAGWTLLGHVYERVPGARTAGVEMDTARVRQAAGRIPPALRAAAESAVATGGSGTPAGLRTATDPTAAAMLKRLACPVAALRAQGSEPAATLLDSRCNYR